MFIIYVGSIVWHKISCEHRFWSQADLGILPGSALNWGKLFNLADLSFSENMEKVKPVSRSRCKT